MILIFTETVSECLMGCHAPVVNISMAQGMKDEKAQAGTLYCG